MTAQLQRIGTTPSVASWLALSLLGLIGGTTFLWIELALRSFDPILLVACRISLAAIVMGTIWRLRGGKLFEGPVTTATKFLVIGICLLTTVLPFLLVTWGQQYVTSGFASIALASSALIVSPLAHVLVPGERMNSRGTVGLIIGFFGVILVIGPAWTPGSMNAGFLMGELACLLAAACYALSSILICRLPPVDPIGLTAVMLSMASAILIPVVIIAGPPIAPPDRLAIAAIILLALASTAGSNLLAIGLARGVGPNFLAITNFITPLIAVIVGTVVLSEPVTVKSAMGFLIILCGIALGKYGFWRANVARKLRLRQPNLELAESS